ncbi:MAG: hypothetical protein ACOY31_07095 [Bacillota bacterium]
MRRIVAALFLALVILGGLPSPGWCGGEVSLQARPGLAGIYKVTEPVRIQVDIQNSGEEIKGHLDVGPRRQNDPAYAEMRTGVIYRREVVVPGGGGVSLDMVVPGGAIADSYSVKLVVEDRVVAEAKLDGTSVAGGMVIIPLGESLSRSGLFSWLDRTYGGQVTTKYISPAELPEKPLYLQVADVVVVDRESASRLSAAQAGALEDWVKLGGTLILSGRATSSVNAFAGISPVPGGEAVSVNKTGKGRVIVTRTPIESAADNQDRLWEEIGLFSQDQGLISKKMDREQMEKGIMSSEATYLPMGKIPGIPALMAIWGGYVLIVGPGIYFLLKRFNRRDMAWALVPAAAVAVSACFFALSPVNRTQPYIAHEISVVDILDRGLAGVKTSETFVLPGGGGLEVRAPEDVMLNADVHTAGEWVTVFSGDSPGVVFDDVEYGSMRQVFASGTMNGAGSMDGNIYLRDDRVMGEIKNNTPFDLRDCRILLGSVLVSLGDIPSGGVMELNHPINWSTVLFNPGGAGYQAYSVSTPQNREERLVNNLMTQGAGAFNGSADFIGFTDSPVSSMEVVSPSGQGGKTGLTLVRQSMEVRFPEGDFKIPAGFIKNTISSKDAGYRWLPGGLVVDRGTVEIDYDLRGTLGAERFRVTGISVQPVDEQLYDMEIFRQDLSQWENVSGSGLTVSEDEAGRYLSEQGRILLKVTRPGGGTGVDSPFRGITVEGVVGK